MLKKSMNEQPAPSEKEKSHPQTNLAAEEVMRHLGTECASVRPLLDPARLPS